MQLMIPTVTERVTYLLEEVFMCKLKPEIVTWQFVTMGTWAQPLFRDNADQRVTQISKIYFLLTWASKDVKGVSIVLFLLFQSLFCCDCSPFQVKIRFKFSILICHDLETVNRIQGALWSHKCH